jgi:hypothetical protein
MKSDPSPKLEYQPIIIIADRLFPEIHEAVCFAEVMKDKLEYKPPWFTLQVIGIAGASASGKTSVAKALVKKLDVNFLKFKYVFKADAFCV